jgi:hypothetical protein
MSALPTGGSPVLFSTSPISRVRAVFQPVSRRRGYVRAGDRRADVAAAVDAHRRTPSLGLARRPRNAPPAGTAHDGCRGLDGVSGRVRRNAVCAARRRAGRDVLFLERGTAAGRGYDAIAPRRGDCALWPHPRVGLGRVHCGGRGRGLHPRLFRCGSGAVDRARHDAGNAGGRLVNSRAQSCAASRRSSANRRHPAAPGNGCVDRGERAHGRGARPLLHVLFHPSRPITATARRSPAGCGRWE